MDFLGIDTARTYIDNMMNCNGVGRCSTPFTIETTGDELMFS